MTLSTTDRAKRQQTTSDQTIHTGDETTPLTQVDLLRIIDVILENLPKRQSRTTPNSTEDLSDSQDNHHLGKLPTSVTYDFITGKNSVLNSHARCFSHKQTQTAWAQYKLNHTSGTYGSSHAEAIQQNRHYLKAIVEVVLLCAKQDLALRGHREGPTSNNKSNLLEILNVVASMIQLFKRNLYKVQGMPLILQVIFTMTSLM